MIGPFRSQYVLFVVAFTPLRIVWTVLVAVPGSSCVVCCLSRRLGLRWKLCTFHRLVESRVRTNTKDVGSETRIISPAGPGSIT